MADYNSSLPIRTENPGDVQIKLVDGANTARVLKIEEDGSINANISTGDLDVRDLAYATDSVTAHLAAGSEIEVSNFPTSFEVSNFPSLADLDIRDLDKDTDSVTAHLAAGSSIEVSNFPSLADLDIRDLDKDNDSVTAHLAAGSQIEISNASLAVTATDLDIRDLDKDADSITAHLAAGSSIEVSNFPSLADLDIRDLDKDTDSVTAHLASGSQIEISNASLAVTATDLDVRDLDKDSDSVTAHLAAGSSIEVSNFPLEFGISGGGNDLGVNADGSINVKFVPKAQAFDYKVDSAVAADSSVNHEFTSSSNETLAYAVRASASGKMRIEVQLETGVSTGVFNTVAVAFNSAANPNIDLNLEEVVPVLNGRKLRIVKKNRDSGAMDMYSTLLYKY